MTYLEEYSHSSERRRCSWPACSRERRGSGWVTGYPQTENSSITRIMRTRRGGSIDTTSLSGGSVEIRQRVSRRASPSYGGFRVNPPRSGRRGGGVWRRQGGAWPSTPFTRPARRTADM